MRNGGTACLPALLYQTAQGACQRDVVGVPARCYNHPGPRDPLRCTQYGGTSVADTEEPTSTIFTTGGTVQAGHGLYIPRAVDDELLALCREGTFAYILAPRQLGKSSLIVRTAQRLAAEGTLTAILDLTRIGTE